MNKLTVVLAVLLILIALVITTAMISAAMMVALAVWDGLKWAVKEMIRRAKREQN